jgi:phosphoribosylformylglycinamidine synthase
VVFRYCDEQGKINEKTNPNGALYDIAGIINKKGNVMGMMPHPERAMKSELGSTDGNFIFKSMINHVKKCL